MRTKIFTSFKALLLFSAILSISLGSIISSDVGASAFNRDAGQGYFTNEAIYAAYGDQDSDVIIGGIKSNNINDFVSVMKGHLNSGGRRRTAASFIINTMLGNKTGQSSWRNMTSSDSKVSTWEGIVRGYAKRGLINWNDFRTTSYNTYYANNDIAWHNSTQVDGRIVFFNANGTPLYQIRRDCGNPVGTLNKLPELPEWNIDIVTSIRSETQNPDYVENDISVFPGETIYWQHRGTNTTNYSAPADDRPNGWRSFGAHLLYGVSSRPDASVGPAHWVGYNRALYDWGGNSTNNKYSTTTSYDDVSGAFPDLYSWEDNGRPPTQYTPTAADVGKKFCQRTYIGGNRPGATGETQSAWRCATVEGSWSADPQSYVSTVRSGNFADYQGSKEVTIYPGQSAYFYHTAAIGGGAQGINYDIQLKGSGNTRTSWNGYDGYTVGGSSKAWIDQRQNVTTNFDYRAEGPASAAGIERSTAYTTFTPDNSDVGTTYCQWIYMSKIGHDKGSKSLIDERACVKVVARPWQLDVSSQVKSSATDDSYKDRSEDLNVTVGETVDWRHALVNSTGHQAPGLDSARGYKSFGHTMTYGTSPEDPTNRYVRFLGNGNLINIDANSTINRETSTTSVNAHSGLSTTYGQDTNGTNLNYGFNNNGQPPTSKQIKPGDVGKRFCQQAYVGQHRDASLGGALVRGNLACVYVPYDYELTPKITVPSESTGGGIDLPKERGTRVDPVPVVENPGGTATRDTRWKVSQWTVPASLEGVKSPGGEIDNTNDDPCAIFDSHYGTTRAQSGCSVTHEGTRLFNSTTTLTGQIDSLTVPDDAELGSRFCFALSISPYSLNDGQTKEEQDAADSGWRHSSPVCILVVKYPKMQVWSNGIYSAGGIRTHRSTINGETFGSWVEYEALATGRISGFASAATNKFSSESPDRLTLSNNRTDKGNWGAWNSTSVSSVISNLESRYPYGATPGSGAIFRDVPNRNAAVMSTTASRYTLSGNPYADAPGKTVIIMAGDTDIDITGDIVSRAPTDGNVSEFQQIIIIGKNIRIASHVGRVDAWLISSGDIVTCAQSASGVLITNPSFITQASCGGSLRVNGPIISNNLKSWRTGGSDIGNLDTPSEIYNQRPDTYIWAYGQSGGDGKIITTYSKELPARF